MKINPVLSQGLRARMRGVRSMIMMVVYLVIVLVTFSLGYIGQNNQSYSPYMSYSTMPLYIPLALIEFGLIVLIVPAMNAGAIASEREKQTLDLLLCSRLASIRLIFGKILSNLFFSIFLIVLTLPFFAIAYLEGGLELLSIVKLIGFYFLIAYFISSIAVFYSAVLKKTSMANVCTYITLVLLFIITTIIGTWQVSKIMMEMQNQPVLDMGVRAMPLAMQINPINMLISLADPNNQISGMFGLMSNVSFASTTMIIPVIIYLVFATIINVLSAIIVNPVKKLMIF